MMYVTDWRKNIRMQQFTIRMSELAEQDLENVGDYIAYKLLNPDAAKNIVGGIRKTINALHSFPESYELDEDVKLAELGVRKIIYKSYKIYYIIDQCNKIVTIVRILHKLEQSKTWMYQALKIK